MREVFLEFVSSLNEELDVVFENRLESLSESIEAQEERISEAQEKATSEREILNQLEQQLDEATGSRRQSLIDQIEDQSDEERKAHGKFKAIEQEKAELEEEKARIEKVQATIRKAQAISQVIINTAVAG